MSELNAVPRHKGGREGTLGGGGQQPGSNLKGGRRRKWYSQGFPRCWELGAKTLQHSAIFCDTRSTEAGTTTERLGNGSVRHGERKIRTPGLPTIY